MTLAILDSMLRGDLRRPILSTLKTEKEISMLWRDLKKAFSQGEQSLMALEESLIAAVETSGLLLVSADYKDDREMRQGAEQAREQGMNLGGDDYTRVDEKVSLEGLFSPVQESTPTDKFLHLLVKVECCRTMECLRKLVTTVHDDSVVRTNIRHLFSTITSLCKDANDTYIKESLTQFYFEVYHTFRRVLEKSPQKNYETDFENFVFEWKNEFPNAEVVARYNEMTKEVVSQRISSSKHELPEQTMPTEVAPKDKFDLFLEAANTFTFKEMPKVKELGTTQKIRQLVECMLQNKKTTADTFGHTAAMLEFLGFYKWIADNHVSDYTLKQYDAWCTKHIMNKERGFAFKHYRLSVAVEPDDTKNQSYKYHGWKYKEIVKEEYKKILEG